MVAFPRPLFLSAVVLLTLVTSGCNLQMMEPPPAQSVKAVVPQLTFTAAPQTVEAGQNVTLTWVARNAEKVTITPGMGDFGPVGTHTFAATESMTLMATAVGAGGETTQSIPLSVSRSTRPPRHPPENNPLKHIIMMFQENRSFDSYFGNINAYRVAQGLAPEVDVADPNATNPTFEQDGSTIARFHLQTMCHENVSPAWNESHVQVDLDYLTMPGSQVTQSRMNGFVYTGAKYARDQVPPFKDTSGRRAMGYYTETDLPYYYFMATKFGISDRWFGSVLSRSGPNRIFSLAATSKGYVDNPFVNGEKQIFQQLEENNISWKIYYTDVDQQGGPVSFIRYFDSFYQAHKAKVIPVSQYYLDVQNGTLPSVALIESGYGASRLDEHPSNNIQTGAAYVADLINALMTSQSWKDSVFFLTYDESGGIYDHVPPPAAIHPDGIAPVDRLPTDIEGDFNRYGMRVPNLVISPYSRPGYVSHTVIDHTALLKFIQTKFNLPSLTHRDRSQSNMYEFFNFTSPPWLIPPVPPVQPTNGPCYYEQLP